MTLQEVIRKGKPFRREIWAATSWLAVDVTGEFTMTNGKGVYSIVKEDILANDWISQSLTRTLEIEIHDFKTDFEYGSSVNNIMLYLTREQARALRDFSKIRFFKTSAEGES